MRRFSYVLLFGVMALHVGRHVGLGITEFGRGN